MNGGNGSAASWDAKHASRLEIAARQMADSMGPFALEGRVGDCCDEEEVHCQKPLGCRLHAEYYSEHNFIL